MEKLLYITKKNLVVPDENFTVKKGTLITLNNVFDETDKDRPTLVGVRFENIPGNYVFSENNFNDLISKGTIAVAAQNRFKVGDCVTVDNHGRGKVKSVFLDRKHILYGVRLDSGKSIGCLESELSAC